jgi:hypothetical protein
MYPEKQLYDLTLKIIKKKSATRKKWLDNVCELAYNGDFYTAKQLIDYGINVQNYNMTKQSATDILESCGIDLRFWFVDDLVDIGGVIPYAHLKNLSEIVKCKKNVKQTNRILYFDWSKTLKKYYVEKK